MDLKAEESRFQYLLGWLYLKLQNSYCFLFQELQELTFKRSLSAQLAKHSAIRVC